MDVCEESVLKLALVKLPETRMEKCLFDTHEIELPEVLLEDVSYLNLNDLIF